MAANKMLQDDGKWRRKCQGSAKWSELLQIAAGRQLRLDAAVFNALAKASSTWQLAFHHLTWTLQSGVDLTVRSLRSGCAAGTTWQQGMERGGLISGVVWSHVVATVCPGVVGPLPAETVAPGHDRSKRYKSSSSQQRVLDHCLEFVAFSWQPPFGAQYRCVQHCGKCTVKGFTMAGMLAGLAVKHQLAAAMPRCNDIELCDVWQLAQIRGAFTDLSPTCSANQCLRLWCFDGFLGRECHVGVGRQSFEVRCHRS
eukprot:symbB.v1.2.014056.t1/scaffold1007.1/size144738/1